MKSARLPFAMLAFATAAVPLVFHPSFLEQYTDPKELLMYPFLALLLALTLARSRAIPFGSFPRLVTCGIVLLAIALSLGTIGAHNRYLAVLDSSRWLLKLGLFLIIPGMVAGHPRRVAVLLGIMIATGTLVSIYGISQFVGKEWTELLGYAVVGGKGPGRGSVSSLGHALFASEFMVTLEPLCLFLAFVARTWRVRLALVVSTLIMMTFIVIVQSRGSWIALTLSELVGAALAVTLVRRGHQQGKPLMTRVGSRVALALIAILLAAALPRLQRRPAAWDSLVRRATSITRVEGRAERLGTWLNSLAMFRDHPWAGVGPGNFPVQVPRYYRAVSPHGFPHREDAFFAWPHNEFIGLLLAGGPLALAGFLLILIAIGRHAAGAAMRPGDSPWLVLGLGSGILANLIAGFFGMSLSAPSSSLYVWIEAGLLMSLSPPRRESGPSGTSSSIRNYTGWRILTAITLVSSCLPVMIHHVARHLVAGAAADRMSGHIEAAWRTLGRAEILNPWSYDVHYEKGLLSAEQHNWYDAARSFRQAVIFHPFFPNALNNLGVASTQVRDYQEAEIVLRGALTSDPDFDKARLNLGRLYLLTSRPAETVILLEAPMTHPRFQPEANSLKAEAQAAVLK